MHKLSVVIIEPDEGRRGQLVEAVEAHELQAYREVSSYPRPEQTDVDAEIGQCDVALIDLDTDPEIALDLVSRISSRSRVVTVMAYSASNDPSLVVRCMRAGAREFLNFPLTTPQLTDALVRAAERRPRDSDTERPSKVLAFWGAKGGVGATTLASTFAIALRAESGHEVALVDLNMRLGDVAMSLGMEPQFSIIDALESTHRLDREFLSALMVDHSSGVSVLAGPDQFVTNPAVDNGNLSFLLRVLRERFSYIVVDAGQADGPVSATLLQGADHVYLITEADVPTLRNTQRLMGYLHSKNGDGPRVELVLNRFRARGDIDEKRIIDALGMPLTWRIPNDYARVQEALNRGVSVAETSAPVTAALRKMARLACDKPASPSQGKTWGIRLYKYASEPWVISRTRRHKH